MSKPLFFIFLLQAPEPSSMSYIGTWILLFPLYGNVSEVILKFQNDNRKDRKLETVIPHKRHFSAPFRLAKGNEWL